jgi:UPF0716 family protein affecting phage T7 exclusion
LSWVIYIFAVIGAWFTISVFVVLFIGGIMKREEQSAKDSWEEYRRMVEDSEPPPDDEANARRWSDRP